MTPSGKRAPSHIGKVRENLTAALVDAIDVAPCSLRALARAAGVSHALLQQIKRGDFNATREVAEKVAGALDGWAGRCAGAARKVRAAARRVPNPPHRGT